MDNVQGSSSIFNIFAGDKKEEDANYPSKEELRRKFENLRKHASKRKALNVSGDARKPVQGKSKINLRSIRRRAMGNFKNGNNIPVISQKERETNCEPAKNKIEKPKIKLNLNSIFGNENPAEGSTVIVVKEWNGQRNSYMSNLNVKADAVY